MNHNQKNILKDKIETKVTISAEIFKIRKDVLTIFTDKENLSRVLLGLTYWELVTLNYTLSQCIKSYISNTRTGTSMNLLNDLEDDLEDSFGI